MPIEVKLPAVGENIDAADVGQVLVKEGDTIQKEQVILELETQKAVIEIPSPHAGKIAKLHVKQGDTVKVGATILTLDSAEGAGNGTGTSSAKAPANQEKKAVESEPSPSKAEQSSAKKADAGSAQKQPAKESSGKQPPAPAAPATRRLARELGVDLHEVHGTGSGGRITPEDVQGHIRGRMQTGQGGGIAAPPLPDFAQWGEVERQGMNKIARTSAAGLSFAWQTIPHVTQHDLVDITDLETGRKRFSSNNGAAKVTMTILAMKACVAALKAFPQFNSSIDMARGEIILKKYFNIGVAVDTEHGLLVPVVRDVDKKSVLELAAELTELANKTRARKVDLADLRGGTFTITNLGGIGGTSFTPIVNYPEVAILGMSRAKWQPVVIDGKIETRLMMPLSLSYDHRVINGADGARFINKLNSLFADPFTLLSEM